MLNVLLGKFIKIFHNIHINYNIMKVLSFDVGIKNLAYCLFDIKDKNDYCIQDWGILHLCNEEKHECCGKHKHGKK